MRTTARCLTGAMVVLWAAAPRAAAEPPAELVLRGGAVYTLDAARSWATAVAVREGRVVFVGGDSEAGAWIGPGTRVVELRGGLLLPAFQDAHVHPISGVELLQCDLNELPAGPEPVLEKIRSCLDQPGEWLIGGGWALPAFPGGAPRREDLDAIVPDRPAFLTAADGHSAWVNGEALRRAGVTRETPDPEGGRIERDPDSGEPTGTLREKAMELVRSLIPPPTPQQRAEGLELAVGLLNAAGVTAALEANADRAALEVYRDVEARGRLSLRVTAALDVDEERGPGQIEQLAALRAEFSSDRLRPTAAKIFVDGVIEARTAAMLEPYLDTDGDAGTPMLEAERLNGLVAELARAGFSVHMHAIGDGAVRMALDAVEAAGPPARSRALRHQLAHVQVVDPDDAPRFRRLGVIANFQPLWAFPDTYITELTWPALGPQRSAWIYPMRRLAADGAPLAFGSDWTVSSLKPLEGIQVAVTRQDPREPGPVMQPWERLDLPTALAAYTIGAAWANGLEAETGSIEVGKRADLVVLERNLFEVPHAEIGSVPVRLTLLDGQPVYRGAGVSWEEPGAETSPD